MENRFGAYPEVTFGKDISCEEFIHMIPGRLSMTAGCAQQDQLKQSWSRRRADEPCQYDQSDHPLTLETQFFDVANMSNGEF